MINPKRDDQIETTLLPDGHVVLVPKQSDWAHTLSPLGALVWEFCDGTNSVNEIVALVRTIPGIGERHSLEEEITALIAEFREDGFLSDQ